MRTYWLMTAILGLLLAVGGVHAQQQFPAKPIRLIVPAPSGSVLDIVARTLATKLTETFRQSVVVDNQRAVQGRSPRTERFARRADSDLLRQPANDDSTN